MQVRTMHVAASKPYDILIGDGLLDQCGAEIATLLRPARMALVTDDHVSPLYGKRVMKSLTGAGFDVKKHVLSSGQKGLRALDSVLEFLGEHQMLHSDPLVWLGGGAVGDVAGMAASIYAHGMYLIQIPTTLVAAEECTVGGRHAVDLKAGRNLVSATLQPTLALCDTQVLGDLPDRLTRDGTAEMLKYALLGSEPLLQMLESGAMMDGLDVALDLCVRIKLEIVRTIEYDPAAWQLLRMGSLIGRGVEACSGGAIGHGDALAVGLLAMARAAAAGMVRGGTDCAGRVEAALSACGMDGECRFGRGEVLTAIAGSRVREERYLTIAAPVRVGECVLRRVTMDDLGAWLEAGGISE